MLFRSAQNKHLFPSCKQVSHAMQTHFVGRMHIFCTYSICVFVPANTFAREMPYTLLLMGTLHVHKHPSLFPYSPTSSRKKPTIQVSTSRILRSTGNQTKQHPLQHAHILMQATFLITKMFLVLEAQIRCLHVP